MKIHKELQDIPEFHTWKTIEKINSGWSKDLKYYVEDYSGNKLLLRISDISWLDAKMKEFWEILAVYVAHASLSLIVWAEKFGENEINEMKRRSQITFEDYENFQSMIPHWYKDNFMKYRK